MNLQWTLLEENNVANYLAQDQLELLSRHKNGDGTTPLRNIMRDVCSYIQSRIPEKLHPNPLAPRMIPNPCKTAACQLVIEALQSRIPEISLSEDQVRNAQQARQSLEELYKQWSHRLDIRIQSRIEAAHFRIREAHHQSLKGL